MINQIKTFLLYTFLFISLVFIVVSINYCNKADRLSDNIIATNAGTTQYITTNGHHASETQTLINTRRELRHSEGRVEELVDMNKELGIKLRKTKQLLSLEIQSNGNGYTITKYDTVYKLDTIYVFERDTFTNDYITIYRNKNITSDSAYYQYSYNADLFASINWFKRGNWKLINIVKWRKKKLKINITSSDTNLITTNVKHIIVK